MTLSLNFNQAIDAVLAIGATNSILLRGAPGMGKTSAFKEAARRLPDYRFGYVDCATLETGDLALPYIDRDRMVSSFAPNVRFGVEPGSSQPVLILLDEISKSANGVLNMLLPLVTEHRLGNVYLPTGSIVCMTGNLATDGVGDKFPAHAYNRVTEVDFRNPLASEWLLYAANAGVAPAVMAFVRDNPNVFARYDEVLRNHPNAKPEWLRSEYPYIFFPTLGQTKAFCSARSLERASHIVHAREALGEALLPLLAGTVGEAAARMIEAAVALDDRMPSTQAILAAPESTALPADGPMYYMMATRLGQQASEKTIERINTYVLRWQSNEAKSLYTTMVAGNPVKVPWAMRTTNFNILTAAAGKFC